MRSGFADFLRKSGLEGAGSDSVEVRIPGTRIGEEVFEWHSDCGGGDYWMFIWANIHPTEVRHKSSKEPVVLQAGHVYLFHNREYEHRTPECARTMADRWFIRSYKKALSEAILAKWMKRS